MTSELRPAVEVSDEIVRALYEPNPTLSVAVIEADREAVRAEQAAELAKWKALAETLAGAVEDALRCTPQARHGAIIYDCGDPWEILTAALAGDSHD